MNCLRQAMVLNADMEEETGKLMVKHLESRRLPWAVVGVAGTAMLARIFLFTIASAREYETSTTM